MSSSDERRPRDRRTGATPSHAALTYSGQQQRPLPPFPSVGRLVEKYTMLIERHRQRQNGLTPTARRKSPSPRPTTTPRPTSPRPTSPQPTTPSPEDADGATVAGPPVDDPAAAAWSLMDDDDADGDCDEDDADEDDDDCDGDDDDDNGDDRRRRRRRRRSRQIGSCGGGVLLPGVGGAEDGDKPTTTGEPAARSDGGGGGGCDDDGGDGGSGCADAAGGQAAARPQAAAVDRLEVNHRTKVKRKRRKSWTGPAVRPGACAVAGNRKGHSLDQGYETTHHREFASRLLHHHHHHAPLFRSYSGGDGAVVILDGGANGDVPGARQFRTPSVVVSDHSEDPVSFSSMFTLDDLDELEARSQPSQADCPFNDSSSDCSAASTWSAAGSVISVLDADYSVHTPERKISGCSTCSSAFSGAEDEPQDADRHRAPSSSRPKPKHSGWRKLRNIVQWTPFFQHYKKQRYPWVQLAGHQGNFKAGPEPGTILKKLCPKEQLCFQVLMNDVLKPYVPEYKGHLTTDDGDLYLQLEDLLGDFTSPCVMDCKIGVRTYLEEELAKAKEKPKLRKDMYEKMIQIDPNAPSEEEHRLKGVTKPRYMVWRETISSTATLGFRIEGIKKSDGKSSKDFKTTKSRDQVIEAFRDFVAGFPHVIPKYIGRLKTIRDTLMKSKFFTTHEVIGSSLLFVHDSKNANIWLIDFAKTLILPPNMDISHMSEWVVGNHEDGYLIGINNLLDIFTEMAAFPVTLIEVTAPSEVT